MMNRPSGKVKPPKKPIGRVRSGKASQDADFQTCWDLLGQALTDIHNRNAGSLKFEHLYRASYKIVVRKRGLELYDKVESFERAWFERHVLQSIFDLASVSNLVSLVLGDLPDTSSNERRDASERFLKGIRDSWEGHTSAMAMATDVLMYLDRDKDEQRPPIYLIVIGLYRDHILRRTFDGVDGPMTKMINAAIFDLINMERKGDVVDRNLIKRVLAMYESLAETDEINDDTRLYMTTFEPAFIASSRQFYADDAQQARAEGDLGHWLRHTERRLLDEMNRCDTTISKLTLPKLLAVVEDELITKQLDKFVVQEAAGIRNMIDNENLTDLSILYRLVSRQGVKEGIDKLKKILSARIVQLGLEIEQGLNESSLPGPQATADGEDAPNNGAEKPKPVSGAARQTVASIKWVTDVLALKDKFDKILRQCFRADKVLESAVTKSFSDFINRFGRSSEFVSLFIDDNLKHSMKGMTEQEIETTLDKAVILIRYLQDKDMFQRYYQKHLARRLLHGKSESQEAEKMLIGRMKLEVGSFFTLKFEGMFKDMETSRELTTKYSRYVHDLGDVDRETVHLDINVLTSNHWPQDGLAPRNGKGTRGDCNWPDDIRRLQQSFLQYYMSERNGRVLTWLGSLGTADITCMFPKVPGKDTGPLSKDRRYELNVSTHGMIILLLFNDLPDGASLGYEEIQAATNIPANDLNRALASLTLSAKARVLLKEPQNKSVKSSDKFSYNSSFVSKTTKIRAPIISAQAKVEDGEERKETVQKNDEARRHIVDAAIVRIMKARKELAHNILITEIITVLAGRFKPDVALVKKRIDDLISRQYIERVEDADRPLYRYMA